MTQNEASRKGLYLQGKVAHEPRRPTQPALIPVSVAWSNCEYCYSPLDGMLVHRRVTPSNMSPVPIYTPGWRETMWGKVSCLRKQHDRRDWALNHRQSDLKFKALNTTPPRPHRNTEIQHASKSNVTKVRHNYLRFRSLREAHIVTIPGVLTHLLLTSKLLQSAIYR